MVLQHGSSSVSSGTFIPCDGFCVTQVSGSDLFSLYANGVFVLQKRLRKDADPVKPAATVIGTKRPALAATRAPLCK